MGRSGSVRITYEDGTKTTFRDSRTFKAAAQGNPGPQRYAEYLASPEWKVRRAAHLAKFPLCKGCKKVATQVHHRDYSTIGHEKERHLLSVCASCHWFIHKHISRTRKDLWGGTASAIAKLNSRY